MSAEILPAMDEASLPEYLRASGPLLDVRTPAEFAQGHIPGATNVPLFQDEERAAVGTCYKQQGRQAAVQLGLSLVAPRLSELAQDLLHLGSGGQQPLRLYCWRGGLRSGSVAWLGQLLGLHCRLLPGGYKSFRRWALASFEKPWPLLLLGGRTGCGKTDLLQALAARGAAVIDLEGLAHHRGSSFGGLGLPPQPSSEHFENRLALQLLLQRSHRPIWVEAESAQVGRCRIPAGLWSQMKQAPVVELQRDLDGRLQRLVAVYGDQGQEALHQATERIARRLGPQRTAAALAAIAAHDWTTACRQMLDYYDRCYDHELRQRQGPPLLTLAAGNASDGDLADQLLQWQSGLQLPWQPVPTVEKQ
jgi:tRNA 2-selenouridine synthase